MDDRDLAIICIAVTVTVAVILLALWRRKRATGDDSATSSSDVSSALAASPESAPIVRFEEVLPLTDDEERRLVKIEDGSLLAVIDQTIPVAIQRSAYADAASKVGKAVETHNKAAESAEPLYRAIIPKGTTLDNSRAMEGAKRGIYHGEKGIQGHANLVPADQKQIDPSLGKEVVAANVAGSIMNVASLVVGQYYMSQINGRLDSVEKSIGKVVEFQDVEYRSRVYALIAAVKKSSTFSIEVMENEELRLRELSYLKERENECTQLLSHANIMLEKLAAKTGLGFDEYEASVNSADSWIKYQQVLLTILAEISELTYTLNKGNASRESSYALLIPFANQASDSLRKLSEWHEDYVAKYQIDTASSRRRRQGFEAALFAIPALFKDDLHYRRISSRTSKMIRNQKLDSSITGSEENLDLYQEDVTLIMRDGSVYYLLPAEGDAS